MPNEQRWHPLGHCWIARLYAAFCAWLGIKSICFIMPTRSPAGRVASCFSVRCMRSCRPFCCIAKLKLALVIGAPEIVGQQAIGQGRSFGSTVAPTHGLDQSMAIEQREW